MGRVFLRFVDEDTLPAGDTTPPVNPSSLSSSSHPDDTPSNDATVDVQWSGASDAGSGLDGFSYVWDSVPATVPPTAKNADETPSSATSPTLATGSWYFHLRTRDKAGNWSAGAVHLGPFVIDTTPVVGPPPAPAALPTLRISNARVKEGNRGTKAMTFLVRLSGPSAGPVTVGFKTQKGTAKPKSDFVGRSGVLTFAPGQTLLKVVVKIKGDRRDERNEKFTVMLLNAASATIADAKGVGTIRDND